MLSEESFSNHKYLAFELREFVEEVKLTHSKRVDWQKLEKEMNTALSSFEESGSLDPGVDCFYDTLYEQLDEIAPRRAHKPREVCHWYTPELSSMREELKHLFTHKSNPEMAARLRQVLKSYSSLIGKDRNNS